MTAQPTLRERSQVAASHGNLRRLSILVREAFGIDLPLSKAEVIRDRLAGRMEELGLHDFGEYLDLLSSKGQEDEREVLISTITTNVTHFFRETHHFEMLEREVLPPLIARARAGGRVRLWSAGCSTGQEAFSIAACVLALCPEAPGLDIRILGTDLDQRVIQRAASAIYSSEETSALPPARRRLLFTQEPVENGLHIRDELCRLVAFNRLNLIDHWPMRRPFDAIFCRNVAIYLDKVLREQLWLRFADVMVEGGLLFVGHSERVLGPALARLDHAGVTAYRKRPGAAPGTNTES